MYEIEIANLSKSFGSVRAVNNVSFAAKPGRVTGFLGPNGSGKTTTLAMLAGLINADKGTAMIGKKTYAELEEPMRVVGVSLSAVSHPAHTGKAHLEIVRKSVGMPPERTDHLLNLVGLSAAATRKTGGYSLGMKQRLALAAALMGDPQVIVLDEPVNGLDPEGIRWIRDFLRHLAAEGKTVLLSSHLLSEVEQTVDDLVVINRGEIVYAGTLADISAYAQTILYVDSPDRAAVIEACAAIGGLIDQVSEFSPIAVRGVTAAQMGQEALNRGILLTHLSEQKTSLETIFMQLTSHSTASLATTETSR